MAYKTKLIRKPTLKDVARLADVSISTASTALSNPEKLRKSTLDRITAVIDDIGYIRNGAAQALVKQRSSTIAVVVPTIDNPMYSVLVAAIQTIAKSQGYYLLIGSHEFDYEAEHAVVCSLLEKGIDGLILIGCDHESRTISILQSRNIPFVLAVAHDESEQHHAVGFSNKIASTEMAKLVIELGHRKIALCGGFNALSDRARQRFHATLEVLTSHGIDVPEIWQIQRPFTLDGGREAFRYLWALEDRPTALICFTDVQAIGAIHEAGIYKVSVPNELSITGFDDIEYAALCSPPLTTTHVPTKEIGVRVVEHLLDLINSVSRLRCEVLPTKISLRSSLAPPLKP